MPANILAAAFSSFVVNLYNLCCLASKKANIEPCLGIVNIFLQVFSWRLPLDIELKLRLHGRCFDKSKFTRPKRSICYEIYMIELF